jgi:hypothetical protein
VAAAFPLPEWLKIVLVTLVFAPFGLFLLLQALVWITRPSAAEIAAEESNPMTNAPPQSGDAGPPVTTRG